MFNSLKSKLTTPVTLKHFLRRDGAGNKLFSGTEEIGAYIVTKDEVVVNSKGAEVVSNTQVYIDGATNISKLDNIVLFEEEYEVQSLSTFFWNNTPDIKVVYI